MFPIIQKIRCEIERRSYSGAETTCTEIARLIESKELKNKNNKIKRKCHDELGYFVEKLIGNQATLLNNAVSRKPVSTNKTFV